MRERPKIDLGLTGYDEMFMNDQERAENRLPKIYDIPLNEIDDFPDHPFKVRLDEDMDQLVESVKSRGVIYERLVYGYLQYDHHSLYGFLRWQDLLRRMW